MQLSREQVDRYERDGYLFFDRLFSPDEVAALAAAVPEVLADAGPGLKHEPGTEAVRMVHGPHLTHELIARLSRHPRLLQPAQQLLGEDVYTFQSRLVMKTGIGHDAHAGFPWHQDYSTWAEMDGMPEPRALVFAIFVDEVTACNAPVMFVPGSHRQGMVGRRGELDTDDYSQIIIDRDMLDAMVAKNGLVAQLGAPGSVLMIHPNLVHASPPNISPLRRALWYVIYNAVSNQCTKNLRRAHHSSEDVTPLVPLDDDCLCGERASRPLSARERAVPARRAGETPAPHSFAKTGVVFPIPVLAANEVQTFRAALDDMQRLLGGELQRIDNIHLHFRWARELACHPRVLDALEEIIGPDILVHSTRIFYKHPRDGGFVGWHQDGLYSNLNEHHLPTAWIALSDSNARNGCVRVVPGSHRGGVFAHRETFAARNLNNHGEEAEVDVDERDAVDLVLRPGEMSLHDVNILHSSRPNDSDTPRIGFSVSYITPAVTSSSAPVVRARGNARIDHLPLWDDEPLATIDESLAAHEEYIRERNMRGARVAAR
jgi:ectoine hydroxylase